MIPGFIVLMALNFFQQNYPAQAYSFFQLFSPFFFWQSEFHTTSPTHHNLCFQFPLPASAWIDLDIPH